MKSILTLCLCFYLAPLFGQKNGDTKIIITISDSTDVYEKVKHSLVNSNFMVKDNGNRDTITTYSREYSGIHCIARAIIKDNIVILTGAYGLKKIDDWGYTQSPKKYEQIIYYKGSKSWKLLIQVANSLSNQINFSR